MKPLVLATGNQGKVREMQDLLNSLGYKVSSLAQLEGAPTIAEDAATFEGNAILKAKGICEFSELPTLADDSGLEVDALGGIPGVHSARYGGEGLDDRGRYQLLLRELTGVPDNERTARFRCCLAYVEPHRDPVIFEGTLPGRIARCPEGDNGFGYDPVFIPDGLEVTLAQVLPREKRSMSHRARALAQFTSWLKST